MSVQQTSILIVDDEPQILEIFALWLGRSEYLILTASNGAEALAIMTSRNIDVLITDMQMPVMDGLTLIRRLHELRLLIPSIIFVSGFIDTNHRELYALGAEALLTKPLARDDLIEVIERSLQDREELWLKPTTEFIANRIEIDFASLEDAMTQHEFGIGRGGFCMLCLDVCEPKTIVELNLNFKREKLALKGQARVRWYHPDDHRAGFELVYLDKGSRRWAIEAMRGKAQFSYIPSCGRPSSD